MTTDEEGWSAAQREGSISQLVQGEEHVIKRHVDLNEYDWLSSSETRTTSTAKKHTGGNFGGDIELRLGIGPPSGTEKRTESASAQSTEVMTLNSSLCMNMEIDVHRASTYMPWQTNTPHLHVRKAPTRDWHNQMLQSWLPEPSNRRDTFGWVPPVLLPGPFVIPVPKVIAVAAKRPYPEPLLQDVHVHQLAQQHHVNTGSGSCIAGTTPAPATVAFPALLKQDPAFCDQNRVTNVSTGGTGDGDTVGKVRELRMDPDRAAVVGWPPIRSCRKNTLAACKESGSHVKGLGAGIEGEDHLQKQVGDNSSSNSCLFVKAKLDGVKIGRKVDLKAYDSYDSLKLALQDMFQSYVNGHGEAVKLDLIQGDDYVLTHEDKEGDWMLVGDVPWEMFATTVNSLRIMKSCDARCLGERGPRGPSTGRL